MIYSASEQLCSALLSAAESENCLEMPSWQRPRNRVCHTYEKLQYGNMLVMMTLTPASFSHNNGHPVSDELHKSNRLSVCLPTGVGARSETAVSVPASCSLPLSVFLQPGLISAFQLSLILFLHCPLHKEFWANFTSVLCCWKFCCSPSAISVLCVVTPCALINLVSFCFSWKSSEETVDLTNLELWVNRYLLDFSVCVQCKQQRPRQRPALFTQWSHRGAHRLHCLYLNLRQNNDLFSVLGLFFGPQIMEHWYISSKCLRFTITTLTASSFLSVPWKGTDN